MISQEVGVVGLRAEFGRLADETGLLRDLHNSPPYAGAETIDHLIRWGLLERDPSTRKYRLASQ